MYIDNFLEYNRVCLGYLTRKDERICVNLLDHIRNNIGRKCFFVDKIDMINNSLLIEKYIVSTIDFTYEEIDKFTKIENFLAFKHYTYVGINDNRETLPNKILYSCDLILMVKNGKINVVKDGKNLFQNKDLSQLYNDSCKNIRELKLKKILENERFTKNRKMDILHPTT